MGARKPLQSGCLGRTVCGLSPPLQQSPDRPSQRLSKHSARYMSSVTTVQVGRLRRLRCHLVHCSAATPQGTATAQRCPQCSAVQCLHCRWLTEKSKNNHVPPSQGSESKYIPSPPCTNVGPLAGWLGQWSWGLGGVRAENDLSSTNAIHLRNQRPCHVRCTPTFSLTTQRNPQLGTQTEPTPGASA
jgi:hypothetical protein